MQMNIIILIYYMNTNEVNVYNLKWCATTQEYLFEA